MPKRVRTINRNDQEKIKKLSKPDISLLAGLFAFGIISDCASKAGITSRTLVFVLIINYYHIFKRSDGYKWGLFDNHAEMDKAIKRSKDAGLIATERSQRSIYYLTLKGQNLVKQYQEDYKSRVADILKDNAHGNPNSSRRPGAPTHKFD